MYYTSSGAYRKTKVFIDYANVFLTLCIVVLFVCTLVFADWRYVLFPSMFFTGAVLNLCCGIKKAVDKQKSGAVVRFITMLVLIGLGVMCLLSVL